MKIMKNEKKLISLEEHNDIWGSIGYKNTNGIECPNCGEELYDSDDGVVLLSSPGQKHILCYNCNYKGRRYLRKL